MGLGNSAYHGAPKTAVRCGETHRAVTVAVTLPSSPVDLSVHRALLLNLTSMAAGPQHPEKCGWSGFEFPETHAGCARS